MILKPLESPHMHAHALAYARRGMPVFPLYEPVAGACSCGDPDCANIGKHPRNDHGVSEASTDKEQIRAWWSLWPNANIALACGDGFFVVDVDPRHGGDQSLAELESRHGKLETLTVITGSGGQHKYFKANGTPIKGRIGMLPGLDIKSAGGYVVACPSLHACGKRYRFASGSNVLSTAPAGLVALINRPNGTGKKEHVDTAAALEGAPEGQRNETAFKLACKFRNADVPFPEALELVLKAASKCTPAFPSDEARQIVERVYQRYEPASEKPRPSLLTFGFHDAGNSDRIRAMYGDELRYCHAIRKFLHWDGRRWQVDETGRSLHLAKMMAVEFLRQATAAENTDAQRFARATLNARLLKSALELSTPDLAITPAELDVDPWFLNCLNGVVDLRSDKLLPHDPARFVTKLVHHNYNTSAKCPTWKTFLYRVMGIELDEDRAERMVQWLQKALGYSITGNTREKAAFVCNGPTDTGKTTLTSTIRGILPEYSVLIQIDSLMMRREESNNSQSDLADLRGARFAVTSETEAGQRLAVGKLKRITQGQGDIKAVRKYENPITFKETHKLWLDANHKPLIRDSDDSIWNRVYLIPFEAQIPKAEQDRDLPSKLMAEAEGILAWLVAGTMRWYSEGLGKPAEVMAAGKVWRVESDVLGDFIEERCIRRPEAESTNAEMWRAYTSWCDQNSEHPMRRIQFLNALVERGCTRARDMKDRKLRGIELRGLFL